MIRLLEENYRKMEQIIRVLSISDQWMTKKELAKEIGSSESTFLRYVVMLNLTLAMSWLYIACALSQMNN